MADYGGRGRPTKTCSDICRDQLRKIRRSSPQAKLTRHKKETYNARDQAGFPRTTVCRVCGGEIDAGQLSPKGYLETGFDVHEAYGSDRSDEFFSCKERRAGNDPLS
tara:strand:+ start:4019 stop:4339 length:321 start_codon:yes stop_codon:yes gene_type:complete